MDQNGTEGKMKSVQRQRKECRMIGMRYKEVYYKGINIERKRP